jgi:hypothetical protein
MKVATLERLVYMGVAVTVALVVSIGDVLAVTRIDRLARSIGGPSRHRARGEEEEGRVSQGYRTTNRHQHGGRVKALAFRPETVSNSQE